MMYHQHPDSVVDVDRVKGEWITHCSVRGATESGRVVECLVSVQRQSASGYDNDK